MSAQIQTHGCREQILCLCLKCVINSTIYLRGIYRKIFFNLAEFHFWPLMLMLQRRTDARLRRRTIVKCQTSHRCHGGQRTSAKISKIIVNAQFQSVMIVTMGAPPKTLLRPNQINVFLVGPKFGGRNKIACRFIKL